MEICGSDTIKAKIKFKPKIIKGLSYAKANTEFVKLFIKFILLQLRCVWEFPFNTIIIWQRRKNINNLNTGRDVGFGVKEYIIISSDNIFYKLLDEVYEMESIWQASKSYSCEKYYLKLRRNMRKKTLKYVRKIVMNKNYSISYEQEIDIERKIMLEIEGLKFIQKLFSDIWTRNWQKVGTIIALIVSILTFLLK